MNSFYLYRGDLTTEAPLISADNRAFLFGESIFTTFILRKGRVLHLDDHQSRLENGVRTLMKREVSEVWKSFFVLLKEYKKQIEQGNYRVRVTIFIEKDELQFLGHFCEYRESLYDQDHFLKHNVMTHWFEKLFGDQVSPLETKIGSYADRFYYKNVAITRGYDDVLFVGQSDEVYELATSNIVFFDGNCFNSPSPSPNVLDGIQLRSFERFLLNKGEILKRKSFNLSELLNSDCVLSFNSAYGLKVIDSINKIKINYENALVDNLWNSYKEYCEANLESIYEK